VVLYTCKNITARRLGRIRRDLTNGLYGSAQKANRPSTFPGDVVEGSQNANEAERIRIAREAVPWLHNACILTEGGLDPIAQLSRTRLLAVAAPAKSVPTI